MGSAAAEPEPGVEILDIRPQPGPQVELLTTEADIAIIGGAAGGGKTWALLADPIRWIEETNESAVMFRRTYPQITNPGGLWDEAGKIYPYLHGSPNHADHEYRFESGFKIRFAHMQHAKDRSSWDGAQLPIILFDQLESFEENQFWYMLSRNRSATAPFSPYIRASCNPVPPDDVTGGWLNALVSWWIDDDGYAIPERGGVLRYFARVNEKLEWGNSPDELRARFPDVEPKSLTFIPSTLDDNPILTTIDPTYVAALRALPKYERLRLLGGNWKVRPEAGDVFDRASYKYLEAVPLGVQVWIRYWDKAGTEGGGAYSSGVLMGREIVGLDPMYDPDRDPLRAKYFYRYVVADVVRGQWSSFKREREIKETAGRDALLGAPVVTWVEREPGSGGKESAEATIQRLAGFDIRAESPSGSKLARTGSYSSQVEAGNVYVVRAPWTEAYVAEHHRFDGKTGVMDQVDSSSGAFNKLAAWEPEEEPDGFGAALF